MNDNHFMKLGRLHFIIRIKDLKISMKISQVDREFQLSSLESKN